MFSLSADQKWRRVWGSILTIASLLLLISFTYHSYQVTKKTCQKQIPNAYYVENPKNLKPKTVCQTFSSAVFSHVSLSKHEGTWPTITICERQGLSRWNVKCHSLTWKDFKLSDDSPGWMKASGFCGWSWNKTCFLSHLEFFTTFGQVPSTSPSTIYSY